MPTEAKFECLRCSAPPCSKDKKKYPWLGKCGKKKIAKKIGKKKEKKKKIGKKSKKKKIVFLPMARNFTHG